MMEWNEYLECLLAGGKEFENLSITLGDGSNATEISPIIKSSIMMLDKMIEHQGNLNLIVFPEKSQFILLFIMMKLYHNIAVNKIKSNYDPTDFRIGEKLKVGNAVVEYLGTEKTDGSVKIIIKLADLDSYRVPVSMCPIFQRVSTKRGLSKNEKYVQEKKKALAAMNIDANGEDKLLYVSNMKTHMDSSILSMTSITGVKERLPNFKINGEKATDIFYIAQTDYEGQISNISPGQMSGVPEMIFASDLYSINAAAEKDIPIQSIIIDGSNSNTLMNQLDALDDLIRLQVPIVCISDVADSFELEQIEARGFNVWRWGSESITKQLYEARNLPSDLRTKNCALQEIKYLEAQGHEISNSMKALAAHRKETEDQSPKIMKLFEKLNSLTFSALRTTTDFSDIDREMSFRILTECKELLDSEKDYLSATSVSDYSAVIRNLEIVFSKEYSLEKKEMLMQLLKDEPAKKVFLIISEKENKDQIQKYWESWCLQRFVKTKVIVMYPSEYYSWPIEGNEITVICGWMRRAVMRKIIYSYNTCQYFVLLYDYENRWQKHDYSQWNKVLTGSTNKSIIEKSFSTKDMVISTKDFEENKSYELVTEPVDELGEIELTLRENKYRQYANGELHSGNERVDAIPINFVGGYLAFYRTGHKVVSATRIIAAQSDRIDMKLPSELAVGDFIVVRETDKDLIRELADIALKNSGKENLRELASKWREAMQIELVFCSIEDLYEKLKNAGCDKGLPTVKRWIEEEDVIAPQSKEDLRLIGKVTENEMLMECIDSVYEAAQEVRAAHMLAGRKLAEQLRMTLGQVLKKHGDIDQFNFWEPIDIEVEGIGNVKVLKIIDIGTEIEVDSTNTNRLIEE